MHHAPQQPVRSDRCIKLDEVKAKSGLGTTKIYAMIKAGQLPAPRKFGRASRWSENAVDAALSAFDTQPSSPN